jgi:nucleotide-binding universal stress UspA family protein
MRTLIIATDLGQASQHAVAYGVRLARDLGAEVLLVHAWRPAEITVIDTAVIVPVSLQQEHTDNLQHHLDRVAAEHRASGVAITTRLIDGELAHGVAALAAETGAEMVVVGTSLPRMLTRILGSSATAVIRAVRCPVLVVHETDA